jgi:subtilisin family serine protease
VDPALRELIETTPAGVDAEVVARLADPRRLPPGFRLVSRFGTVVTGRVPQERLEATWAHEAILSLKAPRNYHDWELPPEDFHDLDPEDTEAISPLPGDGAERTPKQGTGRGVVVGICDWGIDFAHDVFRNADGSTRFLAIWHQSAPSGDDSPAPYGYGAQYGREAINAALATDEPYQTLGYHCSLGDPSGRGSHGTVVASIAAGNGRAPGAMRSAASEAELAFVHLSAGRNPGLYNLGDSVRLLEALDFVRRIAEERDLPWVCNFSLGKTGGPHDATTLVEQAIDALVTERPGRIVVMSTGNYHSHGTHTSGPIAEGERKVMTWDVHPSDRTQNELEVWYSGTDRLRVALRSPDGETVVRAGLGERRPILYRGEEVGRLYHRFRDPNNLDHHIDIFLERQAPAGRWQVMLQGQEVSRGLYHGWIERDPGPLSNQSHFGRGSVSRECTTGTICNGFHSIATGAYDAHDPAGPLTDFSSGGRLRSGRFKPDIVAPGYRVIAARSAPAGAGFPENGQRRSSGTSMAAPHVTGAAAAVMQAAGRPLSIAEVRSILFSNTHERRQPGPDEPRLGYGRLDLDAALEAARTCRRTRTREQSPGEIGRIIRESPAMPSEPPVDVVEPLPALPRETPDLLHKSEPGRDSESPDLAPALAPPGVGVPEQAGTADETAVRESLEGHPPLRPLPLSASVGEDAPNRAADLRALGERLQELGLMTDAERQGGGGSEESEVATDEAVSRILDALGRFQERRGLPASSLLEPGSDTHRLLMRPDLPVPRDISLEAPVGRIGKGEGNRVDDLVGIQERLRELGYLEKLDPAIAAGTEYGELPEAAIPRTIAAIEAFQRRACPEADGCISPGDCTLFALEDPSYGTLTLPAAGPASRGVDLDDRLAAGAEEQRLVKAILRADAEEAPGEHPSRLRTGAGLPLWFGPAALDAVQALEILAGDSGLAGEHGLDEAAIGEMRARSGRTATLYREILRTQVPAGLTEGRLQRAIEAYSRVHGASVQEATGLSGGDLGRLFRSAWLQRWLESNRSADWEEDPWEEDPWEEDPWEEDAVAVAESLGLRAEELDRYAQLEVNNPGSVLPEEISAFRAKSILTHPLAQGVRELMTGSAAPGPRLRELVRTARELGHGLDEEEIVILAADLHRHDGVEAIEIMDQDEASGESGYAHRVLGHWRALKEV